MDSFDFELLHNIQTLVVTVIKNIDSYPDQWMVYLCFNNILENIQFHCVITLTSIEFRDGMIPVLLYHSKLSCKQRTQI